MRLTVLGGCGVWPAAGQACSGYLLEHDGYRVLIDPGYAVLPRLLQVIDAGEVDAVLISHGHPDHCADLNPLLRARVLRDDPALAYTGDTGPSPDLIDLARGADLFLAEATYPREVPADSAQFLSSAWQAGQTAARAGVAHLMLTHLRPGADRQAAVEAAAENYDGEIDVAAPGSDVAPPETGISVR
ncbi:MAG TPA: MBL fold metallo-hydrolase [Streptosporangiaceae bacterium]